MTTPHVLRPFISHGQQLLFDISGEMTIYDYVFPHGKKNKRSYTCEVQHAEAYKCLLCGGDTCKRCGPTAYLQLEYPALERVHSTWITDAVLAMQRPTEIIMSEAHLIEQFQRNRIKAIFNLTEVGEHPFCGCGNLVCSGFSYNPEQFMRAGINHFNYSWRDMTVPTINLMMDIVHVAVNEIWLGGRIAVHCHAGYGRTGTAIACILIAVDGLTGKEATELIRQRRPGSIQTRQQAEFIVKFENHYRNSLRIFPELTSKSLKQSVTDQFYSLSFQEISSHKLKSTAKIIYATLKGYVLFIQSNDVDDPEVSGVIRKFGSFSIVGLKYSESRGNSEEGYPAFIYDECFDEIPESFYNKLKTELNKNNWATIYNLIDILSGDNGMAHIIGLIGEEIQKEEQNAKIASLAIYTIGFLLFSFLETRSDQLFSSDAINSLLGIWIADESESLDSLYYLLEDGRALTVTDKYGKPCDDTRSVTTITGSVSNDIVSASRGSSSRDSSIEYLSFIPNIRRSSLDSADVFDNIAKKETLFSPLQGLKSTTFSPIDENSSLEYKSQKTKDPYEFVKGVIEGMSNIYQSNIESLVQICKLFESNIFLSKGPGDNITPSDLVYIRMAIGCVKGSSRCAGVLQKR